MNNKKISKVTSAIILVVFAFIVTLGTPTVIPGYEANVRAATEATLTPSPTLMPTPTPPATATVTLRIFGNDDIGGTGSGNVSISPASLEGISSIPARYGTYTYTLTFPINTIVTFRGNIAGAATCYWDGHTNPFSVQVVGGEIFTCNFYAPDPTRTPTPTPTLTPTPTSLATATVTLEIFGNDDIGGTGTGNVSISPASLEGTSSIPARYGAYTYTLTFPINTIVTFRGNTAGAAGCGWDGHTNPFSVQVVGGETFTCNFYAPDPTCTPTPTPPSTPTPTGSAPPLTPTPAPGGIKVQFFNGNTAATTNTIYINFKLVNTGTAAITLSDVKMRYYYTNEGTQANSLACDWSTVGNGNVTSTFGTVAKTNADRYCEVGFTSGAGTLGIGGSVEVKARIWKSDWSNFTQTNDYSFNATAANYVDWIGTTGYVSGILNWGTEP